MSDLALRLRRRVRARLRDDEGGFMLLETLIAISLITVIMGAVGAEYVTSLAATNHARLQANAVKIASSTMETLRAYDPSDMTSGRTQAAAKSEYQQLAAMSNVVGTLTQGDGTKTTPDTLRAYDSDVATGDTETVPTTKTSTTVGTTTYSVWQYLECTSSAVNGSCITNQSAATKTVNNIRAVVVVTWTQSGCPVPSNGTVGTCAYTTASIINADPDPVFDINQPLPPAPVIKNPDPSQSQTATSAALTIARNDQVSYQFATTTANTGVAPLLWNYSGTVPQGLTFSSAGVLSGTVTQPVADGSTVTASMTVTVQDAYGRPADKTLTINWTIEPALTVVQPTNQVNLTTDSVNLPLVAKNGSGSTTNYSWSDASTASLPAGLTVSPTGVVTGTPTEPAANTAPTVSNVALTVTDSQACVVCASGYTRSATANFTWTINYPPVVVTSPPTETWTVNTVLAAASAANGQVQMAAVGGDRKYTYAASGLPTGLTIGSSTGLISGTPNATASGTATVTVSDRTAGVADQQVQFAWSVVAKPAIDTPATQTNSIGAPVTLTAAAKSCPNSPCSYGLTGAPTGLQIDQNTGVISGTIASGATSSTTAKVTVTDAAGAAVSTGTFTWTVVAAPTVAGWGSMNVTETATYSRPLNWTCAIKACTIKITGSAVPGLGLETTANKAGNNSADTSLSVTGTSGTVYVTGTIQNSAVTTGTNAGYSPTLVITSSDKSTNSYASTQTAYVVPTVAFADSSVKVTETATASKAVTYACYSASASTPCVLSLSGAPAGIGLSATASQSADLSASTSLTVTAPTGTVYLTGKVQDSAVTTGTSKAYTLSLAAAPDGTDLSGSFPTSPVTATWTAFITPTVANIPAQRSTIGQTVSSQTLTVTCPNSPCTYTDTLPDGLDVLTSSGTPTIAGTVASSAVSTSSAKVTVTDAAGAQVVTPAFTYTIDAAPTVSGLLTDRIVTVGSVYSGSNADAISYSCPRTNCTITIDNAVPGIGLSSSATPGSANNTTTSLVVTASSGTVYLAGTAQSSAVTSGSSTAWSLGLSITDGGNFKAGPTSTTWTAFTVPTLGSLTARNVTVGAVDNTAVSYTCPTAAKRSCVITLGGTPVPGVGLKSAANQSGDNSSATSLTVSSTSGTVYLTGTVQASAVPTGTSKAWAPSLTVTDGGQYTSAASTATWTAFKAVPTAAVASSNTQSVTVGIADDLSVNYTCPSGSCTVNLSNTVPGLGLNANAVTSTNNVTSLAVSAASGTVHISGLVSSSAVTGSATSAAFTPSVVITDNSSYTSSPSQASWTVYAQPAVTGLTASTFKRGATSGVPISYKCPTAKCVLTVNGPSWVYIGTSSSDYAKSRTLTATSGTNNLYVGGTPGSSDNTGAVTLTITDGLTNGYSSTTSSVTFTVTN